jgi:hypothetical protein
MMAQKPESTHEAFQFLYYHGVNVNSALNYRAMLTRQDDLHRMDWTFYNESRHRGFVSAFINDQCGSMPEHGVEYGHPDLAPIAPFCLPEYQPPHDESVTFHGPYSMRRRCLLGRRVHEYAFEYLGKFWRSYSDVAKFGIVLFIEGHEATYNVPPQLDDQLAGVIAGETLHTEDTVVVVASDHGSHIDAAFATHSESGVAENKWPVLFILVPRTLLRAHPELGASLRANEQSSLLSPYDLHATLSHLIAGSHPNDLATPRGASLLAGKIPPRSCHQLFIPQYFCGCL